jgi:hypothetical protein
MWLFFSLTCIHSYWTLAFILSWEAVWADCSNYWAWTDNSDRRDWLFSNWKNKVSTSFSFHPITHVSVYCCLYLMTVGGNLSMEYTIISMIIEWHNAFPKNAIAFGKKTSCRVVNISETEKEKRIHSRRAKTSNATSVSKRTYHNCCMQAEHATGKSKARWLV